MLSIWEKNHWVNFDLVVIGGGIVGLSTAISWKERNPDDTVVVLERGTLPTGASTRNAGFACFGSLTELLRDIESIGEEGMLQLVERRWKGLQKLRKRLGDKNMDLQLKGGYELLREKDLEAMNKADDINAILQTLFKKQVFQEVNNKINDFGFNKTQIKGLLFNSFEGQINSGLMMKNLVKIAREKDIEIRTGCLVKKVDVDEVKVVIGDIIRSDYTIKGRKIAICTNAFATEFIPTLSISPGRGIVLVTEKFKKIPFQGTFHYDEGYYYFRDFGQQVIFGGGRNLFPDEETTTSFEINKKILKHLTDELHETILPDQQPNVAMSWAGIMAFGNDKKPVIQLITENIGVAARLGGMGVAIGSTAGEELAEILEKNNYN